MRRLRFFLFIVLICMPVKLGWAQAEKAAGLEAALLANTHQLTFDGRRTGEGYFSADGRSMIFQSEREPDNPFYQMYILDLETGETRRISPGHGKTTCGWIHPNGRKALFASTQGDTEARAKQKAELDARASGRQRRYTWDYDETYDIYDTDLETGVYRNLTMTLGYDAEGAYSPDGRQIVFASNRAAYARELNAADKTIFERDISYFMDLYIMNADGSNVRRLTSAPGYDGGPFFSADGSKIVWRRFSKDGARAEIYTMNIDGSEVRQITRLGAMSWAPFFHPSGDYIIFTTNLQGFANFELYLVDTEGRREPVRVTHRNGFDGLAAFSPDGRRLAWSSKRTSDGTTQIFRAGWNDAAARRLLGLPVKGARRESAQAEIPVQPRMSDTSGDIRAADLKLHVTALSSRHMEGRLTGTPGETRATEYVAKAFSALGLKPAGDNGTYFQRFDFTAGVSLGSQNRLNLTTAAGTASLALGRDWRPAAFSRAGEVGPSSVVFAGFGLVAPADKDHAAYDSYEGLEVKDSWVLVYRGLPKDIVSQRRRHLTRYADLRYKASVARARGARGLIIAPQPGVDYSDELLRLTYEASTGAPSLPVASVNARVAEEMLASLGKDLAASIVRLNKGEKVTGRILPRVSVAVRIDLVYERKQGRNVLAWLGSGAHGKTPSLVIGAHVDHLGHGETSGSLAKAGEAGKIHHGADDNASGVAALIEIAQRLKADETAGKLEAARGVLFAAWSGEELGLIGSSHFVKELAARANTRTIAGSVSAYLNMDMVGRLDKNLKLFGLGSSSIWKREIERGNVSVGLAISTSSDTYLPTDATSFYLKGVPILHAFTGAHRDYSTPRDTADKINYTGLEKVARLMSQIARSQARAREPPDYIKHEKPRGLGARRRSAVYLGTIPDYATQDIKGVAISGVMKGGPAEKAGVKSGDVIVGIGGLGIENIYDYVRIINGLKVGEAREFVVLRNGARVTLSITPAPREE